MRRVVAITLMASGLVIGAASGSHRSFHNQHIYAIGVDGSGLVRIGGGGSDYRATPSPQGRKLAFYRLAPDGFALELWLMDADGANQRRLAAPTGLRRIPLDSLVWGPVWSPAGTRIAFPTADVSGCPPSARNCATFEINAADVKSGSVTRIAGNNVGGRGALNPSWSPDGKRIVFEGDLGLFAYQDPRSIYVANADGSRRRKLVSGQEVILASPAWSPNGRWIAYTKGGRVVHVAGTSGSRHRSVAPGHSPVWSPNGRLLAYLDNSAGDGIYTVRPDGQGRRRVTTVPDAGRYICCGPRALFAWSPDASRLAFVCCREPPGPDGARGRKSEQIYVVRTDGRDKHQVTTRPPSPDFTFSWSDERFESLFWTRDGRRVLFVSGDPAFSAPEPP